MNKLDQIRLFNHGIRNSCYGAIPHQNHLADYHPSQLKELLEQSTAQEHINLDLLKKETQMKTPDKITIHNPEMETFDCECCGFHSYGSFKVEVDGEITEHVHDGHFGSGEWDGEDYGMYALALADIFDAHYVNFETDESIHSIGFRYDLQGLWGEDLEEVLKMYPNKTINVTIFERWNLKQDVLVGFGDQVLNFYLDDTCFSDYEHGELDMDKTMKFIFEKVCKWLDIAVEYI